MNDFELTFTEDNEIVKHDEIIKLPSLKSCVLDFIEENKATLTSFVERYGSLTCIQMWERH